MSLSAMRAPGSSSLWFLAWGGTQGTERRGREGGGSSKLSLQEINKQGPAGGQRDLFL